MKIPARFAAEFDELSRVQSSCQSSGSEHPADLSDLVNSFLETGIGEERQNEDFHWRDYGDGIEGDGDGDVDHESRVSLGILFDCGNDAVKRNVHVEVKSAFIEVGGGGGGDHISSSPDFKRRLMSRLRSRGIDAGLCKSNWEKNGHRPPGEYEYMDVNAGGSRYIIEVFLAGEFTIARPTESYAALLEAIRQIYVGEASEMKQVVRLMCDAIRRSMRSVGIHVPPWRRRRYMEAKWFGPHRRTASDVTRRRKDPKINGGDFLEKHDKGLGPILGITIGWRCRQENAARQGVRMGNLAAILN